MMVNLMAMTGYRKIRHRLTSLVLSKGSKTYLNAFGVQTLDDSVQSSTLATDAIMIMASCTKLMTSIAALQLVEKGLIALDDDVSSHLPELGAQPILGGFDKDGKPILKPRKNKLTLR